mgnify:FL=1
MNKNHRYEIKFILDNAKLSEVNQWANNSTYFKQSFKARKVNSIYFDDVGYSSIRDNLAGISNRKKMRLRWYGRKQDKQIPSFEIKYREGRLGWKESIKIKSLETHFSKLKVKEIVDETKKELTKEGVIIDEHIFPTLQTSYDRKYFSDPEGIRLTIDENISFHSPLLYSDLKQNLWTKYPLQVMEIKFHPHLKKDVSAILKSLHLTPKRHSKYLVGMSALGFSVYI